MFSALNLIRKGMPTLKALAVAYDEIWVSRLGPIFQTEDSTVTFEAGLPDYKQRIDIAKQRDADVPVKIEALRQELTENLQNVSTKYKPDDKRRWNHYKGVLGEWRRRYRTLFDITDDEMKSIDAMEELLDGKDRNLWEIFHKLSQTFLMTTGALGIIWGVAIALGIGIGVLQQILIWINGLPGGTIASFIIGGSVTVVLAIKVPKPKQTLDICVSLGEKMLDQREKKEG